MLKNKLKNYYSSYGIIVILALEVLFFSLLSENFFTVANLMSVARQLSFVGIAAVGVTFLIISGGIDISTGSNEAFTGVFCCLLMVNFGFPMWLAIIISLVIGLLIGTINGIFCVRLGLSPLISTLAMQSILKGAAYLITNAQPIYGIPDSFKFLGQGYIFGVIPVPLIVMIVCFIFGYWVLNMTYIGRYFYAVGGNVEAARLSGINPRVVMLLAFGSSALFASIAGVLMAGRLGSGQPSIGVGFEMDVITAIVLGGVSINGGSGNIIGVFIGTLIMGILSNGMLMIGLSDYWQWVVKGLVLVAAVSISNVTKNSD